MDRTLLGNMRKITVVSTQTDDVFDIESSAETWGELMRNDRLSGAGRMRAMVRETRNTLESPEAILPAGDFTLYLSPTKVKSGWSQTDLEDIDEILDILYDAGDTKHLQRFMERLRQNGGEVSSTGSSVGSEFPVTSSSKISAEDAQRNELLRDARRTLGN